VDISRQRFINRLGYTFQDEILLELALTHRSCGGKNNERLEFLGDAVLGQIVAELLYRRFETTREGEMSRLRSSLVKGTSLADIARDLQIGDQLILGAGERKSGGYRRDSILADTLEAIIGAIYLEAGLEVIRGRIEVWFAEKISKLSGNQHKDAKTRLQEFLQGQHKKLPVYEVVSVNGESHEQSFTVECRVELLSEPVTAKGSNRRSAEQIAAEAVLLQLQADK
jgi:ribonuclease-3